MLPSYVLITPARDEAEFIELTIKSVIAQTVRPIRWVIVSDGSTDGTDEIVNRYAADHAWIELVRMPERRERHFAGKAHAFNAGYARVKDLPYEAIGSLDGDLSFDEDYFSFLLGKLVEDPALGLVGTPFKGTSDQKTYDFQIVGLEHVSGACQLFRRECFEEIGGYTPVKLGGVDYIALITARMKGWKTRTFTEKACLHYREMGTAEHGRLSVMFRNGIKDYAFGGHPLWECFRVIYQMKTRPLGGLVLGMGYVWGLARRIERPIPKEVVAFRRREQMQRLNRIIRGGLSKVWGPRLKQTEAAGGETSALHRNDGVSNAVPAKDFRKS
jgi:glycosyltransferase involved in cell wall biosynthesis